MAKYKQPLHGNLSSWGKYLFYWHYVAFLSSAYLKLLLLLVLSRFSCVQSCDSMDCSTPGFPVLHYLLEFAQTHVHWVSDATQPSHPLSPSLLLPSVSLRSQAAWGMRLSLALSALTIATSTQMTQRKNTQWLMAKTPGPLKQTSQNMHKFSLPLHNML